MSNTIRTFIAITLDPEIQQALAQAQDYLKKLDCNIKWVKSENIHLTLKFLGEVKLIKIDMIAQTLDGLFKDTKTFQPSYYYRPSTFAKKSQSAIQSNVRLFIAG